MWARITLATSKYRSNSSEAPMCLAVRACSLHFTWTLRILSGISEGICNTMVQSGGEFLYIGVGGR